MDGVHILYKMLFNDSFYFLEVGRAATHFFQQLPTWLFIKFFPSKSLSALTQVFSFGLIWIHIISLAGCYFILPAKKKSFLFFPLFGFLSGPLTGLGASISASLSVFSYIWFAAFVFYYADLSSKTERIVFLFAPIPLLFSHEMMLYMAWPLIYLCLIRLKSRPDYWSRSAIMLALLILLITSIQSVYFLFFPVISELQNRSDFFRSLLFLEFFFKSSANDGIKWVSPSCIAAFFLLSFPFIQFAGKYREQLFKLNFICLCLSGAAALILPFYELFSVFRLTEEEENRVWVSCFALPFSLLIWFLCEKNKMRLDGRFFAACAVAMVSLAGWRAGSDYQFYRFQKQLSESLSRCRGIVDWREARDSKGYQLSDRFIMFHRSWKYLSSSLIYPRRFYIQAAIAPHPSSQPIGNAGGMVETGKGMKNNKFFNFDKLFDYEKRGASGCR